MALTCTYEKPCFETKKGETTHTHTRRTRAFERGVPKQSHLQSLFFLKALYMNSNLRCKPDRLITRHIHSHFAYLHFAFSSLFL